jgi:hypothetical protein
MSINNHARQTLLGTFTGVAAGGTKNLTSTDLGDIFGPNADQGGYTNLTDLQDDIVVIRKFAGNFLNSDGSDYGEGPTADEAWNAWTYPYSTADGVTAASSGSKMYNLTGTSTDLNLEFPVQNLNFILDNGVTVRLPAIAADDIFYVIRKTKSNNKIVTFEPSARITANNLNTALDQNFFLGQEAEMWFQNYHKLSPAIGQPGGLAQLDSSGLIPNGLVGGYRLSRESTTVPWNAKSYTIQNLPTPTANDHAANKFYVDEAERYGGNVTPQQVDFTITSSNAGTNQTYTTGLTWAQTDPHFFIVAIDGVLQIPFDDFTIPSPTTIQIVGATNEGDVIDVRNMGRTGANTVGTATITSTGSTVGRTLAARFAERYNILDFAVDGYSPGTADTGLTDDAAPTWNAAVNGIAAAGGGTMFIPRGYYHFTTRPIELSGQGVGSINIEGEGPHSVLVKRYSETGTGTYSGPEGVYRGLICIYDNTNNNSYIRDISFVNAVSPNRADGSPPVDGDIHDHTGDGSAISIFARTDSAPGQVWIDNVHCTGTGAGVDNRWDNPANGAGIDPITCYTFWKCGLYCDGSQSTSTQGVRGIYVNACTFFCAADAAFKAVGVNHYTVTNSEANVGRTAVGGNTVADWTVCCGVKLLGGTETSSDAGDAIDSHRPTFANCDFQSNYGIEIGNSSQSNLASNVEGYVRYPHYMGNVGNLLIGIGALHPVIVGAQTNYRQIDQTSEKYTLITSGVHGATPPDGAASHSHIYGGLRLRGQGLTVGEVNSSDGEVYLPADGDLALYGKLEISESTAPTGVSPDNTVRLYADSLDKKLYARFDDGYPIPIADNEGKTAIALNDTGEDSQLLEDQPAGLSYWIKGKNHSSGAHSQSPDSVAGETWWIIDNYNSTNWPEARYPVARGWKLSGGVGGWTRTQYSGRVNESYDDLEMHWTLTSGGPAETYTVTTPPTATRAFDASDATLGDLRNVLGTLIDDLRAHGIIAEV